MGMSEWFTTEDEAGAAQLRVGLMEFYNCTDTYDAFLEANYKPEYWRPVVGAVSSIVDKKGHCDILEFGAGRTVFDDFLGRLRDRVTFDVQDVTPLNYQYLLAHADHVFIGDLQDVQGKYDLIFSTFVWEHLTRPRAMLTHLLGQLRPGGSLFIASPRYDFPFYISPSARHLSRFTQLCIGVWLMWRHIVVVTTRRPAFLLHKDPAVFHKPWFRDADAVHWVSILDMKYVLPRGWIMNKIGISARGLMSRFYEKYMLLFVEIRRDDRID
jgi:SAM-dependent methyltransferase